MSVAVTVSETTRNVAVTVSNARGAPGTNGTDAELTQASMIAAITDASAFREEIGLAVLSVMDNGASGIEATTTTSGSTASGATSVSVADGSTYGAGHGIYISGAGAAGGNYIGEVSAVAGNVLTVTPATATTVAGGTLVHHDDTAAIQACIDELEEDGGTIYFPVGFYRCNGPFQDTSNANAVLLLPSRQYFVNTTAPIRIEFRGPTSPVPTATGGQAILHTKKTAGNLIGGYAAYADIASYTQVWLTARNLVFRTTENPNNLTMIDCSRTCGMVVTDCVFDTGRAPAAGYIGDTTFPIPTNPSIAIKAPRILANAQSVMRNVFIFGFGTAIAAGEHADMDSIYATHAINGLTVETGNSGAGHGLRGGRIQLEYCTYGITAAGAVSGLTIEALGTEVIGTALVNDPTNIINGRIGYLMLGQTLSVLGATNIQFTNLASPSDDSPLEIVGGDGDQLSLDNTGQQFTSIAFANNGTDKAHIAFDNTAGRFNLQSTSASIPLVLSVNNTTEVLRVANGVTTATGNLVVNQTGQFTTVTLQKSATDKAYLSWDNSAAQLNFQSTAAGAVALKPNNVEALKVSSTAGVTIGLSGTAILRQKHGTATLVSGTVTVSDSSTTANSRIFINRLTDGGTLGDSYSITRSAGASFTITSKTDGSTQASDTSVVAYLIIEP